LGADENSGVNRLSTVDPTNIDCVTISDSLAIVN